MPIAVFLEEYDFNNKTIIPFSSYGGRRFGQSLIAIAKLVSEVIIGAALSIHYSRDIGLSDDIEVWLETNNVK